MMADRKVYHSHRKSCEERPEVISLILDTMDQKKSAIPDHVDETSRMKFRLIGVIFHRKPIQRFVRLHKLSYRFGFLLNSKFASTTNCN